MVDLKETVSVYIHDMSYDTDRDKSPSYLSETISTLNEIKLDKN